MIWEVFWCRIRRNYCHPEYANLCCLQIPEIRLVIEDSESGNTECNDILPGKHATADPKMYPWYDTDFFEDRLGA